jgi:uncharacterized membrane protein
MELTPEERKKIYEEEKARIEAEEKQKASSGVVTTGLEINIAAFICYVGFWISGIVMLVLEQKNQTVRFHAMQSIVTFGALTVAALLLSWIPFVGGFFGAIIGIAVFILWVILMVKAYQGERYKLPVAGDIAEAALGSAGAKEETASDKKPETGKSRSKKAKSSESASSSGSKGTAAAAAAAGVTTVTVAVDAREEKRTRRHREHYAVNRATRIAGYGGAIFWNILLLIFFVFFYQYVAWYYTQPDGTVVMHSFFTNAYFIWQPILIVALIISIAANIILIIYDKFWLWESIQVVLCIIGVVVVANLLTIFPFDFNVIPDVRAAYAVPTVLRIILIIIAVGLGIAALVHFIRLILGIAGKDTDFSV